MTATVLVGPLPQTPSDPRATPTFRAGTDLVTVDVSVIDGDGRPVENLTAGDFTVRIDGKTRRVVAAELVRSVSDPGSAAKTEASAKPASAGSPGARHILVAVDQLYIPPGSIKPLLNAATRFVDRLPARDEVALMAFPPPAPHVDFTTDRPRVRDAIQQLVGLPPPGRFGTFDIGLVEARAVTDRERHQMPAPGSGGDDKTPVMRDLMARNCVAGRDPDECRRQIVMESANIVERSRSDARISVSTLESLVDSLQPIEGSKSIVLISASMAIDDQHDLDQLIRKAEAARTSFNIMIVDPWREDLSVTPLEHTQAPTENADRRLRSEGLEELAADGRGAIYRVAGSGDSIFDRLALELSASYVLGVESVADDQGRERRKVEVTVKRTGTRVRTSQAYVRAAAPATRGSIDDRLRDALRQPGEINELPVRLSTFTRWDPTTAKVQVALAAAVPSGAATGEYAIGYLLADGSNKPVAGTTARQGSSGQAVAGTPFGASLLLEPGVYQLHLGVVTSEGKRSTLVREINAVRSGDADPGTSDLLVGNPPEPGKGLTLVPESRVTGSTVAAYLELYSAHPEDLDWTFVQFEVARDEQSTVLVSEDVVMVSGPQPSWRVASAGVDVQTLAPGPYVLRARIVRDDKTIRTLTRGFVLERPGAAPAQ